MSIDPRELQIPDLQVMHSKYRKYCEAILAYSEGVRRNTLYPSRSNRLAELEALAELQLAKQEYTAAGGRLELVV